MVGGGLGVLLMGWLATRAGRAGRGRRFQRLPLVCPKDGAEVDVTVVRENATGEPVRVARCPAFSDPEHVRCDERCLGQVKPDRTATEPAATSPAFAGR
jgi:hypothetical protein